MRYLYLVPGVLLFILLLGFAFKNAEPVEVRYYLGFIWQAPLWLMLFISFLIGTLVGLMAFIGALIKQRQQLLAIKRELKSLGAKT
ncbi:MAG: lipopolysaccharide assembly LapA domain-containing protein [Methylophilaceae bacterium]